MIVVAPRNRSNRYLYQLYVELERRHKLLRDDVAVINCLSITSATTAQEIVRYTGRPKNSISRAVAELEAEGILRRAAHLRDGRASTLHLTPRGKKLFSQIKHFFDERDQRLIEVLSEQEKNEFSRLLTKISEGCADWT
jgi:DNA-binding MarR family transcriptional regulator